MQIINYEAFVKDVECRLEHNKCPKEYAEGARDTLEVAKLFIYELSPEWIPVIINKLHNELNELGGRE